MRLKVGAPAKEGRSAGPRQSFCSTVPKYEHGRDEEKLVVPESVSAVFVSYSRADSEFALKLVRDLKAAGISVWLDQLDIFPAKFGIVRSKRRW